MTTNYEPRKKKGRVVPFGYKQSPDDPKLLLPIPAELDALRDAIFYLRTCSYRQVTNWLRKKTGRYISDVGLLNIHKKWQKERQQVYYQTKKQKRKEEKTDKLDQRFNSAFAKAKEERETNSFAGGPSPLRASEGEHPSGQVRENAS